MSTYVALFRIRFTNSLQYRTAALAGLITQFAWGLMQILAFLVLLSVKSPGFPHGVFWILFLIFGYNRPFWLCL